MEIEMAMAMEAATTEEEVEGEMAEDSRTRDPPTTIPKVILHLK